MRNPGHALRLAVAVLVTVATARAQQVDPSAQFRRAGELMSAGKTAEALEIYSALAQKFPDRPAVHLNLAVAEYKAGNYQGAVAAANNALKRQPDLAPAYLFLGAAQLALGQPALAIAPLETAVRALPGDNNARLFLAEAQLAVERFADAAANFETLSAVLPNEPRVWYGLAKTRAALRQDEVATAALDRLRALPPSVQLYRWTAEDLERRGLHLQAAQSWREVVKLSPADATAETKLAWALFRARDYEAALPLIERLMARQPRAAELFFLAGAARLNLADPRGALPLLESAYELDSKLLPNRAALGQALLQTGAAERAIPHLEAALPADSDGTLRYQLARAYRLAGRSDSARKALADYQAIQRDR
jgi:tetratricopeptide (TPR) repeat protein